MNNSAILFNNIPIVQYLQNYLFIGPYYKFGICPCIKYNEDLLIFDSYNIDNSQFLYFGKFNEKHIFGALAIYYFIAKKCKLVDKIPNELLPMLQKTKDVKDIYIAKLINENFENEDQIREWYFTQIGNNYKYCQLLIENGKAFIITEYLANIVKKSIINNFDQTIKSIVLTIEKNAKEKNFIHGNLHIGHTTIDGEFIDFGHSFNFRDDQMIRLYLPKYLTPELSDQLWQKYQIQPLDVACSCTLIEILAFLQSFKKHKQYSTYSKKCQQMQDWIIDLLENYAKKDKSIFTLCKKKDFSFITGGKENQLPPFVIPEQYKKIDEKFPTSYFLETFL